MTNSKLAIIPAIFGLLLACTTLGVVFYTPRRELVTGFTAIFNTFTFAVQGVLAIVGIVLVVGLGVSIFVSLQFGRAAVIKVDYRRAEANEAKAKAAGVWRDAHFFTTTAKPGEQVYGHEVAGLEIRHTPFHLAPGPVNGRERNFTPGELERWKMDELANSTTSKPEVAGDEAPMLAAGGELPTRVELAHHVPGQTSLHSIFLGIGRLPSGVVQPISAPWSRLVMVAVAGATGFGKSMFFQSLAYQLLNAREDVKPVLLDAKGGTFSTFAGDKRLLYPAAREPSDIKLILEALYAEVQKRNELFNQWRGITELEKYNQTVPTEERLPPIPVLFDEFGLVTDNKEISRLILKLVRSGRSAGVLIALGSQSWLSNEISSAIKLNLATAAQFYARSKSQSRILLEDSSAADIRRPGEARVLLPGQAGIIEMQAPDPTSLISEAPQLVEAGLGPQMPEVVPGNTSRIVELFDSGKTLTAICYQLYGYKNQRRIDEIRDVLLKTGRLG